ncbi:MAG: 6,7-dimethyl-8-ribityllumazine synthase [Lacunisphaera sp.]|nr:6,7-dimethyl-8-ribityllumazine synthase [Lacunisphaera sp.]
MSLDAPKSSLINGAPFSIGIVAARFNAALVDALLHTVFENLTAAGVKEKCIRIIRVPGSHEVPWAAQALAGKPTDCVIALGVLIGGDTNHHEMVGTSVSHALQQVALATRTPVINGVIVTDNLKQAEARCLGAINRGGEFARAALEMAALKRGRMRGSP